MSSLYHANSGQLFALAAAFSAALAQGLSSDQLARLGAFFTIVGDALSLYALDPDQTSSVIPPGETS